MFVCSPLYYFQVKTQTQKKFSTSGIINYNIIEYILSYLTTAKLKIFSGFRFFIIILISFYSIPEQNIFNNLEVSRSHPRSRNSFKINHLKNKTYLRTSSNCNIMWFFRAYINVINCRIFFNCNWKLKIKKYLNKKSFGYDDDYIV